MSEAVLLTHDGAGVRTLTMNRPTKLNALSHELMSTLAAAVRAADEDAQVKVLVLNGAGRAFCAGADLGEAQKLSPAETQRVADRAEVAANLQFVFQRAAKPVIAAVHGYAIAGGCGLALACDMVIAAEGTRFGYPEIKRGIVAAVVMPNLARQIGTKPAFELLIRGEHIDAARAYALGMINMVVPAGEQLAEAQRLARSLTELQPQALRATKRLFYQALDLPFDAAIQAGREVNAAMRGFEKDASLKRFS